MKRKILTVEMNHPNPDAVFDAWMVIADLIRRYKPEVIAEMSIEDIDWEAEKVEA